jgi:hypothetical protein
VIPDRWASVSKLKGLNSGRLIVTINGKLSDKDVELLQYRLLRGEGRCWNHPQDGPLIFSSRSIPNANRMAREW